MLNSKPKLFLKTEMIWNLSGGEPKEIWGKTGLHACERGSSNMSRLSQDALSKGKTLKTERLVI